MNKILNDIFEKDTKSIVIFWITYIHHQFILENIG